jgi:hemerythrin
MNADTRRALLQSIQKLSVGVDELDGHHKEMVEFIKKLDQAVEKNPASSVVMEIIGELVDYANYHFGAEEALFELRKYPDAALHVERHMQYRAQLAEFRDMIKAGDKTAPPKLLEFLCSWWSRHILDYDRKYTPYLRG